MQLPPLLVDRKQPWKKCAIHLHISHLIQNHQNIEKRCMFSLPPGKLDVKEGVSSSAQPANGSSVGPRNGITTMAMSGTDSSVMERNLHEPRTHMLVDKRFSQVQQAPVSASVGAYPQPKPVYTHISIQKFLVLYSFILMKRCLLLFRVVIFHPHQPLSIVTTLGTV